MSSKPGIKSACASAKSLAPTTKANPIATSPYAARPVDGTCFRAGPRRMSPPVGRVVIPAQTTGCLLIYRAAGDSANPKYRSVWDFRCSVPVVTGGNGVFGVPRSQRSSDPQRIKEHGGAISSLMGSGERVTRRRALAVPGPGLSG